MRAMRCCRQMADSAVSTAVAVRNPQSWVGEMDNLAEDMGLDHSTHMAAHTQPPITLVLGDPMSLHIHAHTHTYINISK